MLAVKLTENWAKGKINGVSHGPAEMQNLSLGEEYFMSEHSKS